MNIARSTDRFSETLRAQMRFVIEFKTRDLAAGDAVLKALAARIAEHGGSNPAARMGGDEFALLIPHVDGPQQVTRLIERLQTALEQPIIFEDVALHLGAPIRHALQSERTPDYETLAREADAAMYRIKQGKARRLGDLAG